MAVWETLVEVFRDAAMLSVLLHCVHRVFHFDRWRPSIVLRRRLVEGIVDSLGISTDSPDSFSDSLMGDAESFADFLLRSSIGNHHEDFPVVRREMHAEFLERSREFVVALGFYDDVQRIARELRVVLWHRLRVFFPIQEVQSIQRVREVYEAVIVIINELLQVIHQTITAFWMVSSLYLDVSKRMM